VEAGHWTLNELPCSQAEALPVLAGDPRIKFEKTGLALSGNGHIQLQTLQDRDDKPMTVRSIDPLYPICKTNTGTSLGLMEKQPWLPL